MPAPRRRSPPKAIWRTAPVARAFETTFEKGYVAHAPIEPHAAVADVRAGRRDGLGLDADAVSDPRWHRRRARARTQTRPRHHPVRRRRLRRQERRRPGHRSGAAVADLRQAGSGRKDPRGRILLRYIRSGLRREDQFGAGSGRQDLALGLSGVRRRRARRRHLLRHSQPAYCIGRRHVLRRRAAGEGPASIRGRARGARPAPT